MICRPEKTRCAVTALVLACGLTLGSCKDDASGGDAIEDARQALSRGDGLGAEIILRRQLDDGAVPRSQVAALLGEAELAQGNLAEAREWLDGVEFDEATRAHGLHMLGRLEIRSGNLPAAGAAFDKALAAKPDDPELWVDIGRLRYQGGEQIEAIAAADHAVELGPQNARALHFKGQLVRDAYGLAAAVPWFEAGLKRAPDDAALLADYAATLGELGRAKEMLDAVRHLDRIDSENSQVFYLQAVLAARAGKPDLAQALLQRSGEVERERPAAMLLSAIVNMQSGNHSTAAQLLVKLHERQPENRRVQALLARALLFGRNEGELIYTLGDIARRPSASPYLTTLVASAYEARGDRASAAWYLDQAAKPRLATLIALQGDGTDSILLSGGQLGGAEVLAAVRGAIVSGDTLKATANAREFAERFGGSADAQSLWGDARMAAGDAKGALLHYRVAASVRQSWPLVRRMIMAHRVLHQEDEALQLLSAHLRGDPNNLEAAGLLAERLAAQGRHKESDRLAQYMAMKGLVYSTSR